MNDHVHDQEAPARYDGPRNPRLGATFGRVESEIRNALGFFDDPITIASGCADEFAVDWVRRLRIRVEDLLRADGYEWWVDFVDEVEARTSTKWVYFSTTLGALDTEGMGFYESAAGRAMFAEREARRTPLVRALLAALDNEDGPFEDVLPTPEPVDEITEAEARRIVATWPPVCLEFVACDEEATERLRRICVHELADRLVERATGIEVER